MKVSGISIGASESVLIILIDHLSSLIVNHLVIEILRFGVESLPRLVLSIHDSIGMLLASLAEGIHLLFKETEDVDCRLP